MDNITIGYLSWKRHEIFNQTLTSHRLNGLFDIIKPENRYIYFQEFSGDDLNLANAFHCNYLGDNKNIGILNAFIKLVEKCETEYFIFAENDWYLQENKETTIKILEDCTELLKNNLADIIRLRHRQNPGIPLWSRPAEPQQWLKQNISGFPYKLESLSWIDNPNSVYNNIFGEIQYNYKWYITSLTHQQWSNNIFIANTSYLKNVILPIIIFFIENNNKYTGLEDILINHNNYIGINDILDNSIHLLQKTKIAGGEGLFTHKDFI
jgi:hypothetical protein